MDDKRLVSLAVGAGGRATHKFIEDFILTRFHGKPLQELEDGTVLDQVSGNLVVATDSFIINPPIFPGGNIGHLAAAGTINDLLASGARPCYCTMGLVICEGFSLQSLEAIFDSFSETIEQVGMQVVAGDTKVMEERTRFDICITVTGIGVSIREGRNYQLSNTRPGDAIIISGTVGDHGLAVLSHREGLGYETRVKSDCAPLHDLLMPILLESDSIHAMRDPTRGGVAGVLHDLARATQFDILIEDQCLPLKREVRMGCEMLGLNPLDLVNEGKMVMTVDSSAASKIAERLQENPLGRNAAIIGKVGAKKSSRSRVLVRDSDRTRILIESNGLPQPRLC